MDIVDPREKYDDLVVTHSREVLEPDRFQEAADSEAATVGWVVLGFVFDDEERVLLVDQPWADGWLAPGGFSSRANRSRRRPPGRCGRRRESTSRRFDATPSTSSPS